MKRLSMPTIHEASKVLRGHIRKTPIEHSPLLSKLLGSEIYLKLEFLQVTGSFKPRGAIYRMSCLSEIEKKKGVVTCSAGNHGKAVALAAKKLGMNATVYVPSNVDQAKFDGIVSYGVEVIRSPFIGYDDTEDLARKAAEESGRTFISAFDDDETMAGNGGTLAMEVLEEVPEVRTCILPVGGGGLAAGFSFYAKEKIKGAKIIGCQHSDSAGLMLSLERGIAVTKLPAIETVAGGIEGGLGANCFKYLQSRIDGVALASEDEIRKATAWSLKNLQYLIEPSAAVTLAACLNGQIKNLTSPTVIVLSGRNVSLETIKSLVL